MSALLAVLELSLLCAAGALVAHRRGGRAAESLALGIVLALLGLSCAFQLAFLLRTPELAVPLEGIAALASARLLWRRRDRAARIARGLAAGLSRHRLLAVLVGVCWLYLGLLALLIPPAEGDSWSYHLARVLLFQQERTLFLEQVNKLHVAVFPVGADLLSHRFLRAYRDVGVALPAFLAYASIALGSYALARRHAREAAAVTAALAVLGLPELVYQATSTKNNAPAAAAAIASLLLAHRLWSRPRFRELAGLALALTFGLSCRTSFLAFAAPFALLFGVALLRRHGPRACLAPLGRHPRAAVLCAVPVLVLSQAWLFLHNERVWGTWSGPPEFVAFHRNPDGLRGGVANLLRYAVQSVHLTKPVDVLVAHATGAGVTDRLQAGYARWLEPRLGRAGLHRNYEFVVDWGPHQARSGFGPLGFALLAPAVLLCLGARSARLRLTSGTLLLYLAGVSLAVAWFPFNQRMLTPFFAGAGACASRCLQTSRLGARGRMPLRALGVACLLYACVFNAQKPLVRELHPLRWPRLLLEPAKLVEDNVWSRCAFGADRLCHAELAAEGLSEEEAIAVPPGSRVALLVDGTTPIYHLLLANPGARFEIFRPLAEPGFALETLLERREPGFDVVLCLARKWAPCAQAPPRPDAPGLGGTSTLSAPDSGGAL